MVGKSAFLRIFAMMGPMLPAWSLFASAADVSRALRYGVTMGTRLSAGPS